MNKTEEQYLALVMEKVREKLLQIREKMEGNAKDMESMDDYFWENYTEFDEYGYEMYDNKQAMKTRMTQQETYGKDCQRYEKMLDSPYFGRVDFCYAGEEEPETYYIGIANLAQKRASHPLVFDWRAPVSGLFYDYDKGSARFTAPAGVMEGEITRKRQYKIRHGKLIYALENEINIDDEILQQTLSEHADAKLKSIVTTIQKEQNSIIRDTTHRIMAVQGCAGSGKTSVALHRIAYLLYHNRDSLKAAQILILSPNSVFGDYISRILPELGEENVCEMTLDDFVYKELQEYGEAQDRYDEIEQILHGKDGKEADYKQTREYVQEMDRFVLQMEWENMDIRDFSHKKIQRSADWISHLFYEKFCDVPILSRMEKIAEYLIDEEETLRDRNMEEEERAVITEKLNRMYETTDILRLYQQFLQKTGRTRMNLTAGILPYEDVYPMLYLKYAVREMPGRRRVKHLVIDEMQDYSYLQYLLLQKMFHCPMTILGDRVQTMAGQHQDVLRFLPQLFGKEIHCVYLNKSYRSTSEIVTFARRLLEEDGAGEQFECVERHGEKPEVWEVPDKDAMYEAMTAQIGRQEEMSTVAVLCLDQESAEKVYKSLLERSGESLPLQLLNKESMKFAPGISVMPFYLAKGLEFDAVFVPNLQDYCTPMHRQALYINATRALHVLQLYRVSEK